MEDQQQILSALERSANSAQSFNAGYEEMPEIDDTGKSKEELIEELKALRTHVSDLTRRVNSPVVNDERASVQRLQDMFQLIIDTIPVSIWWKDKDSRFLGCNMRIASQAGFSNPSEMIGKTDYDCPWKKEESDWFVEWDRKVMETNRPYHHIIESKLNADGKESWLDTTKVPLHDADGNVIGTLGTFEDITERKLAELELTRAHEALAQTHEELQSAHAQLEERVLERTKELEARNEQLKELSSELLLARDQAMEASKYKSNFLANMSHEIRTPLNSVVAVTELLLKTQLNSDQQEFADIIQSSSRALLEIVQDILDFSKIEAGRVDLVIDDFDLRATIASVKDVLGPKAAEKNLTLTAKISGDLPVPLRGDSARLKQVLLNLGSNAIKFTNEGKIEVLVEATEGRRGNCDLKFTVTDTGIGLVEATAARLFEPFTQADFSITRRFGGTGLGLSICKELVELMGGEIGVKSTEGSGSQFWFTVSLAKSPKSVIVDASKNGDARITGLIRKNPVTPNGKEAGIVLIADDSPLNRKVTLLVLQHLGLKGVAVNDGQQAIEALENDRFDLILMDCQMPVLDGFETTKRIREFEAKRGVRTPIVALTAQAIDGDREKCLDAGMDDYIPKPITPDRLAAVLSKWLAPNSVRIPS